MEITDIKMYLTKIRPRIIIGDIVKLSKKGRKFLRTFPKNTAMIVTNITGDGINQDCIIVCRLQINTSFEYHKFFRSELWRSGKNAFSIED